MDWNELVSQTLKLVSYNTVDDIKATLRWRFGTGKRVQERRIEIWYKWLVRFDEIQQRDALFMQWNSLWKMHMGQGIKPIKYDAPLDEIRKRIEELEMA